MATATLTITPAQPARGDTVQARYHVVGNDGTPPRSAQVEGTTTIGDTLVHVATVITIPGTDPLPVKYDTPTCDGLTFAATDDPSLFVAVVP